MTLWPVESSGASSSKGGCFKPEHLMNMKLVFIIHELFRSQGAFIGCVLQSPLEIC